MGKKGEVKYDADELVDLEEYFGLDDERFADMERIAGSLSLKDYSGPKRGEVSARRMMMTMMTMTMMFL